MPASVKSLRRRSNQKLLNLAIRRRGGIREPQGYLIDRRTERLDEIVGQGECVSPAAVEHSQRWRETSCENSTHQMPTKHRIPVIQARICSNELPRGRLTPDATTESTRPVKAGRLSFDVSRIARPHLVGKREQLSPSPNLQILEDRCLPLDLRPHQPRPRVLLAG